MSAAAVLRGVATRTDTPVPIREQLKEEIAAVELRQQLHRQNEARRPRVIAPVEQDHVVRPRIQQ
jgi:hypothetical protein